MRRLPLEVYFHPKKWLHFCVNLVIGDPTVTKDTVEHSMQRKWVELSAQTEALKFSHNKMVQQ